MKCIIIMGLEMLIDKENKTLIIHRENLNGLKSLGEIHLEKLALEFDDDFYTNDGYTLEINDDTFIYGYDDGFGEVTIILF